MVGDDVLGNWKGEWHHCKVLDDNLDGTYFILWTADPSFTRRMPSSEVKLIEAKKAPKDNCTVGSWEVLQQIESELTLTTKFCKRMDKFMGKVRNSKRTKVKRILGEEDVPVRQIEIYMHQYGVEKSRLQKVKAQLSVLKRSPPEEETMYNQDSKCLQKSIITDAAPAGGGKTTTNELTLPSPISCPGCAREIDMDKCVNCAWCSRPLCSTTTCQMVLKRRKREKIYCGSYAPCMKFASKRIRLERVLRLLEHSIMPEIGGYFHVQLRKIPKGSKSCVWCNQRPATKLLLPCAHMSLCTLCTQGFMSCPVCEADCSKNELSKWCTQNSYSPFRRRLNQDIGKKEQQVDESSEKTVDGKSESHLFHKPSLADYTPTPRKIGPAREGIPNDPLEMGKDVYVSEPASTDFLHGKSPISIAMHSLKIQSGPYSENALDSDNDELYPPSFFSNLRKGCSSDESTSSDSPSFDSSQSDDNIDFGELTIERADGRQFKKSPYKGKPKDRTQKLRKRTARKRWRRRKA